MHRRLRGLFAAIIISAACATAWAQADPPPVNSGEKPADAVDKPADAADKRAESQTHKWEFGTSIRAVGGPSVGLMGTFPVPIEWPEQQVKIVGEQITPNVERHSYRAADGLKQMVFEVPQLPTGATAECFITFEITKHVQNPPADTSKLVIPKDPPREVKKYLNPSPLIEATNAKVRSLARELPAGKETAWEQVQAIADGVRERVKYEQETKSVFKGAIGALRDGKADREDLNATFVAVCRAAKIPARMVWVIDFCYAEFYLEENPATDGAGDAEGKLVEGKLAKGKKPAKDSKAAKGAWYPCVVQASSEIGMCRDFRPIMEKGDNFKVPEEMAVQRYVKEFLTGKGGTGGKPAVEFRRKNVD